MKYYEDLSDIVIAAILEQRKKGVNNFSIVTSYSDFHGWIYYLCNKHIGTPEFTIYSNYNNHNFQYMGKTIMWSYGVLDGQIKTLI